MESEYRQVQEECQELQALLEQRDDQLCTLNQDLLDLTLRMKVCPLALASCEASAAEDTALLQLAPSLPVKGWLCS